MAGLALVISFGALFLGWDGISFIDDGQLIHISISSFFGYLLSSQMAITFTPVVLTLFIGIPLVMLIYSSLRLIIGQHFRIPNFGRSMGMLWVVSLVGMIIIVIDTLSDFKHNTTHQTTNELIKLERKQVLYLVADAFPYNNNAPEIHLFNNKYIIEKTAQGNIISAYPRLSITRSSDSLINLSVNQYASGYSLEEAIFRAEGIHFDLNVTDSLVSFPSLYNFSAMDKLRSQKVHIGLQVPEGQVIFFDEGMDKLLRNNPHQYWGGLSFAGNYWVMTDKGLRQFVEE
jgi:hypothetical protein